MRAEQQPCGNIRSCAAGLVALFPLLLPACVRAQTYTITGLASYFTDWLAHPNYDDYWKEWSIEDHYGQIQVPVFSFGAWYDIFLGGTLRNYVRLKKEAGTEESRRGQKLMVYVGGHAGGWNQRKVGAVDFGDKLPFDINEVMLNWYDALLKGQPRSGSNEKTVKIFVMGTNEWREEEDWPLARAKTAKFYLHSAGAANTASGDGALSTAAPGPEKADQFTYDPSDAVPTLGGPLCCEPFPPAGLGPQDQTKAESRNDVLVFTTPAMTKDFEVTGPVSLDLYVSSSAVDTDFTRQAGRSLAERFRAESYRGHSAVTLSQFAGKAGACQGGRDVSHHGRPVGDQQRISARTQAAAGGVQQQLSPVRPQSKYRRRAGCRHADEQGDQRHLP